MPLTRITSQLISIPSNYPLTGSLNGTASYATTASFAMNGGSGGGGSVQTGSIANQTVLYNVTTSQDNVITGLNLSSNKWGVSVVEEWNSASVAGDLNYSSCSLLLHFSGSNGSTTFIDNSPSPKTATSNNGAVISTAQSKFGGTSGFFDGTNDYVSIPNNTEFNFASGTFTVEFWVYFSSVTGDRILLSTYQNSTNGWYIELYLSKILVNLSGDGTDITGTTTILANTWYHIAVSGTAGSYKLFINGTQEGSTYTGITTLSSTAPLYIGTLVVSGTGYYYLNGYIDELRITNGIARYTGSFVTQSAEFLNNVSVTQYATKYVGLVGGLNDSTVDYGVEKLSDSSLKIRKMTATGQPLSGSGNTLSASVDRVYVNVLDYTNVMVTSSYVVSSSYSVTSSYATTALTSSYLLTNITECVHLSSTVSYTLPNSNIVIVPFNTALILQNITVNATASTANGIEAYHWRHLNTGIFRLVYYVRATLDVWNMISVCKNNNAALPVGNGYRSGIPNGGAWGISFECLYRVTNTSDRFGLFHWANGNAGTLLAHSGDNPPNTFFVTPDVGTAPTTGYYNSITITRVY